MYEEMERAARPSAPDMPLGLGMELSQNINAMENFAKLSDEEKNKMIEYIKSATDGEDAHDRTKQILKWLEGDEDKPILWS